MIINEIEYKFTIMPYFDRLEAKIYQVSDYEVNGNLIKYNSKVIEKTFGSFFRTANESDYKKARKWVDAEMKLILTANT
jgi:hypothetical protein